MPRLRLLPPVSVVEDQRDVAPAMEYFMRRGGHIAVDTETTGLRKLDDRVLCWSLATEDRRYFISVEHLFAFDRLFQRKDVTWCLANAKFDMHMLRNHGITLEGPKWDIVVMDALEDDTRPHGLKEQAYSAYGAAWGDFKELFIDPHFVSKSLGLDKTSFTSFKKLSVGDKLLFVYDERPDLVHDYASCDAYFTYVRAMDLRDSLSSLELPTTIIPEHKSMMDYYETLEVPFTDSLWEMERNGFDIDVEYTKSIDGPMRDGLASYSSVLRRIAGQSFNPNSTDELREILFDDPHGFKLKPVKYGTTKSKDTHVAKKSTDEKVLKILLERCSSDRSKPEYIFIDTLLKYRTLKKLHGTYVKNIKKFIASDGRIHCGLNQAGARSARISSSDPNLQNIPARNDPYKIRNAFVAPPGWRLIDLDYPQIEFRVAAVLADEKNMLEPMAKGWDIHSANAAAMFPGDVEYEALMEAVYAKDNKLPLTAEMRRLLGRRGEAKTSGLGTMYGEGARKMSLDLGCSVDEAQALIDRFHDSFPSLSALISEMHDFGHAHEMTYTMLGRIRRLWKINCGKRGLEAAEERQSFNTVVQGSSAEMMKLAILRTQHHPDFKSLGGELMLTVHDELIARAPADTAEDVRQIMLECMADPYRWGPIQLTYPIPIEPGGHVIDRWGEAK